MTASVKHAAAEHFLMRLKLHEAKAHENQYGSDTESIGDAGAS